MFIQASLSIAYVVIALISIILSCDALEKSGKEIIDTCYLHRQCAESKLLKDRLLQIVDYAEHWRPKISAAGFYDLNQSTFVALFRAIITYLVILFQLNMARDT
nr:gustatory receptor [Semanotus bifasciatus]